VLVIAPPRHQHCGQQDGGGAPDAAYALALQILSFVSNNAEILAAASVLLTAVLVAWRGYD